MSRPGLFVLLADLYVVLIFGQVRADYWSKAPHNRVKEANARGACAAAGGGTGEADLWSMKDSKED